MGSNRGIMMDNSEKNNTMKRADDGSIRLNKWISDAGICSRREADRLIEAGLDVYSLARIKSMSERHIEFLD